MIQKSKYICSRDSIISIYHGGEHGHAQHRRHQGHPGRRQLPEGRAAAQLLPVHSDLSGTPARKRAFRATVRTPWATHGLHPCRQEHPAAYGSHPAFHAGHLGMQRSCVPARGAACGRCGIPALLQAPCPARRFRGAGSGREDPAAQPQLPRHQGRHPLRPV